MREDFLVWTAPSSKKSLSAARAERKAGGIVKIRGKA